MIWHIGGGMDLFVVTDEHLQSQEFWLIYFALWFFFYILGILLAEVVSSLLSPPGLYVRECPPERRPPQNAFE